MEAILNPYVKQFDKNGELLNPIKKDKTYFHHAWRDVKGILHQYPNRSQRRAFERLKNKK